MVVDAREKEINVANQVRYTETRTIVDVLQIKEETNADEEALTSKCNKGLPGGFKF